MKAESAEEWLERMDELRYDDAELVLKELRAGFAKLPRRLVPRFLGVCGSAYRTSGARLREANDCIRMGLWFAHQDGDQSAYADLLQRHAYVFAGRGQHSHALYLAMCAGGIHLQLGDLGAVGKTLVDQSVFLGNLGRYRDAMGPCELALTLLPEDAHRNLFAAFHTLGKLHWLLHEKGEALACLGKALYLADRVGPWLV